MDEPSSFRVGDWIAGKYQIERVLAGGGMGVVLAARHVELDELRAIKILHRAHCADRGYVDRFLREALAMARVKGEHIVRIHDTGRLDDGLPYIVMEHLEGMDLARTLHERGPLPIGEAVGYVRQACETPSPPSAGVGSIARAREGWARLVTAVRTLF
jgi:serine/threonine protein kinase